MLYLIFMTTVVHTVSCYVTTISRYEEHESIKDFDFDYCSIAYLFVQVGPLTTQLATQCLCNHLTMFGSSFFVMPNLVDVSRTAELFATFTTNPVVVCFVGAIFVVYVLVAIWARRKDIQDLAKVSHAQCSFITYYCVFHYL